MTDRSILAGIGEIARRELGWSGEVRPDMRLVEDLELDSLKLLTLAVEVENRFRICLSADDETAIETVEDLVEIVRARLAGETGSAGAGTGTP